jgi:hypothetical protein
MFVVMANLQVYRGRPVSFRRMRDFLAFDGVLEEVTPDGVLIKLPSSAGLQLGDKCIFLLPDLIFLGIFESRHTQSFYSRLDKVQDRLDFSLLATFPASILEHPEEIPA